MKKLLTLALLGLFCAPIEAKAETSFVVADCSNTGKSYPAGGIGHNYAIHTSGIICTNATSGGGGGTTDITAVGGVAVSGGVAGSLPVSIVSGGGTGGTASDFSSAFPASGTAIGLYDGTNMVPQITALTLGDGVNGNNTAAVANWLFNGTTWDRARGDATNGQWVNVKTSALPTGAATETTLAATNTKLDTINTTLGGDIPNVTIGNIAPAAASATKSLMMGGQYSSTQPTYTNGQQGAANFTARGAQIVAPGVEGFAVSLPAAATGGASTTGNIAANNTTAVVVKAGAGTLYGAQLGTIGSVPLYLKIYDATSATCGSGTPVKRLIIPKAGTAADGGGSNISFGAQGVEFTTGLTYCITAGIADNDTTAPAASVALVNLDWK